MSNKAFFKSFREELFNTYGFVAPKDWRFMLMSEHRIWLLTPDVEVFDTKNFRVETKGLYLAYFDNNRLRLSPEGAQLVGLSADKNVLMISDSQAEELIRGFNISINTCLNAEYIILKTSKGVIGVGKNHGDKVLCQFRKNRRIRKL